MLKTLILLPWDPAVSEDVDYVKLEIRESKIRSLKAMEGRHCSPCGWFAIYERNLFGVYIDNDNLFLLLNNNTYYMPEDAEITLHHSIWHGLLRFRGGGKSFEFKYKIFWRTFFVIHFLPQWNYCYQMIGGTLSAIFLFGFMSNGVRII